MGELVIVEAGYWVFGGSVYYCLYFCCLKFSIIACFKPMGNDICFVKLEV